MIRYAKLSRRFTFEAAHHLPFHTGKCKNLHGHTYTVEVTLTGRLNANGIIVDFHDFKTKVNELLDAFDHKCLNDSYFFQKLPPTAENVAMVLFYIFTANSLNVTNVRLYETPDCWVDYNGGV